MSSNQDRVIAVVAEVLEVPRDAISPSTDLIADLGTTSLDVVNLIWRIEEEFALGETPESVLESLRTVGQIVDLVEDAGSDESEVVEIHDIAIASDHAGPELKTEVVDWLRQAGHTVLDLGPHNGASVDYPSFATTLSRRVVSGEARQGILICGSGIGMAISANKVDGIRAAVVSDPLSASLSRKHNDANVLCIGARIVGRDMAFACIESFLRTEFEPGNDGRHRRRVQMISDLENG